MYLKLLTEIIGYFIYSGEIASAVISISSFLCKYILPTYSHNLWFDKIIKFMHKIALNPSYIKRQIRRDI